MYKNLNASSLGVGGRNHELIELTLTHKFRGFDIDIDSLVKQVEQRGLESATRFIKGANITVSTFELTPAWFGSDAEFAGELQRLDQIIPVATAIGATRCLGYVAPYIDQRPYHETFELHRQRSSEVARRLQPHGIRLGLGFLAPAQHRQGHAAQFIATADAFLALLRFISEPNVGFAVDLWEWHVGGGTLETLCSVAASRVISVRVADVPLDADLATITEEQRLLPGATGVVPIAAYLEWLADQGYDGPVTPYCHPAQFLGPLRARAAGMVAEALTGVMQGATREGAGLATVGSSGGR